MLLLQRKQFEILIHGFLWIYTFSLNINIFSEYKSFFKYKILSEYNKIVTEHDKISLNKSKKKFA